MVELWDKYKNNIKCKQVDPWKAQLVAKIEKCKPKQATIIKASTPKANEVDGLTREQIEQRFDEVFGIKPNAY